MRTALGVISKLPPANTSSPADIETVLAQDEPTIECRSEDASPIAQPGSTSNLVRAINTRFDIFDNNIVNNNQPCEVLSDCGPAKNVIKDLVKSTGNKWVLPDIQFSPIAKGTSAYDPTKIYQNGTAPESMGLPRDLCHYGSYGASCKSLGAIGDIGNGNWPRADYFAKYHSGRAPSNASSITRYETYLWEQAQGYLPSLNNISGGPKGTQYSQPVTVGASGSAFDRRVLTVAFTRGTGGVCPSANDPVTGVTWVDVFFVQPGVSKRGNYPDGVQEQQRPDLRGDHRSFQELRDEATHPARQAVPRRMSRRFISKFLGNSNASAGAEMALMMPILFALIFTTFEGGNYMWTEHKVLKGVRDGARYAARLPFEYYSCTSPTLVTPTGIITASTSDSRPPAKPRSRTSLAPDRLAAGDPRYRAGPMPRST